jgi:hypothetical protein
LAAVIRPTPLLLNIEKPLGLLEQKIALRGRCYKSPLGQLCDKRTRKSGSIFKVCLENFTMEQGGVMITIFCEFCQFSAKKYWRFCSKTNVMINFLQNVVVV